MKFAIAIALLAAGCSKKDKATDDKPAAKLDAAVKAAGPPDAAKPAGPIKIEGFSTPEAVMHDVKRDVYLVSNINGAPADKDDNGFISKVDPSGKITDLKFIDGAKPDVTLNAPKGLAVIGDVLFVTDIDTVRMFDAQTGEPKGEVAIPGATFLNDIEPNIAGLLVTDSGLKPDFSSSGTDAIYELDKTGKILSSTKDVALHNPNGVEKEDLVVTFGAKQLLHVMPGGKIEVAAELEAGQLDGVVQIGEGRLAISSWECKCIFVGPVAGPYEKKFEGTPSPASIGWDATRNVLLIPVFNENRVEIQPL